MMEDGVLADLQEIRVPDIGTPNEVDVIEVFVKPGDTISQNDSLITLESDKASMEIPSPFAGVVESVQVKVGDKITEGALILKLEVQASATQKPAASAAASAAPATSAPATAASAPAQASKAAVPAAQTAKPPIVASTAAPVMPTTATASPTTTNQLVYAGPAVRRLGREWGVDLTLVQGSGRKGRLLPEDLRAFVKNRLAQPQTAAGQGAGVSGNLLGIAPAPKVDFAKYGQISTQPLHKIKRLTAQYLHRNWVTIPHVTQFDEADITEMEAFRKANKDAAEKKGIRLTPLAFIMKAVVVALKQYPTFNASLDATGENLILKQYYHLGVAVETPNGLVVPVIRDVDKKGVIDLAEELAAISTKAREKGLMPVDMEGSTFTISSLGGIGGTAFTPIINAPDVAILGVSKAQIKPVYQENEFVPRLMLPLSLSYDHRVIDGAEGARFIRVIAECLSDLRRILL